LAANIKPAVVWFVVMPATFGLPLFLKSEKLLPHSDFYPLDAASRGALEINNKKCASELILASAAAA
jgi:hypothetical protein